MSGVTIPSLRPTSVAVIIPAFRAAEMLRETLPFLWEGTRVPDEVLVLDDGSGDATAETARQLGTSVIVLEENCGPAYCRNVGAQLTKAEILIFLDADTRVHSHTVEVLVRRLNADASLAAVIGCYDTEPSDQNSISQFRNLAHHYVHATAPERISTFWSGCGAIRREVLLRGGGFDARYRRPSVEDVDLGYRLAQMGENIALDRAAQVKHLKRWTLVSALRTDLMDRGVPWVRLLLRFERAPNHLNIQRRYRVSTVALGSAFGCLAIGTFRPWWFVPVPILLATGALAHVDLFRFVTRQRGWSMLWTGLPLHFLQQTSNVLALAIGTVLHCIRAGEKRVVPNTKWMTLESPCRR